MLFCSGCISVKKYKEERGLILAVNNAAADFLILQEVSYLYKGDNPTNRNSYLKRINLLTLDT